MKRSGRKKIGIILNILFVLLLLGTGVRAEVSETRVVRVAFFSMKGFNEYNSEGERTGMDVEYLGALNEFADWDIQYVDCDSWDDALQMLQDGQVDLVGSAQYSAERAEIYRYARFSSGETFGAVMVDKDSNYAYEDFETMKNLTYGVVKTYIRKSEFLEYLQENGIDDPKIKEYDSSAQLRAAQAAGEVDAIVHTFMEMEEGQMIIGRFAPAPFYYITNQENKLLMEEMDQAISELKMKNPLLESALLSKYYSSKLHRSQALTTEEQEYVDSLDALVVGYVDNYYPFSYEQEGRYCGISGDVFQSLQDSTGLSLTYQKADSMEDAISMLQEGKIDVLSYCIASREELQKQGLMQASVYAAAPLDELMGTDNWAETATDTFQQEYDVAAAVRSDTDERLLSVLDKGLGYVGYLGINEYIRLHALPSEFVLGEWIQSNELTIACTMILLILIVLLVVLRLLFDSRKMQQLLYRDEELGIGNLNYLIYTGERMLITEQKRQYAIVYINLVKFRTYSTLYGWQAGNRLLQFMAEILKESLDEEYELCARNQGDRFILMLEVESKEHFLQRLQKLEEKLGNHIHEKFGVHMVIDMGVCFLEDKIRDIKSAIGMANQALEFLRDNSTSEIKVYDEQFEELLRDQHQKEELLESADIRRDFRVYYQEKVDIRSRKIVGAEALVRFVEPKKNVVYSPGFFIPYYEKTGQIRELDFFVLESVCQMLHRRMQLGEEVVPVSCNFSRRHFEEEDFPEKLDRVLEYYGIPRDLIEVEITETIVIEELQRQHLPETLRRLKEKGFRLSIDDFGAGYSSLGVFEQVPAAVIKLDRSFFINRTDRVRQVKIMRQIVSLADSLDAQVVCEGVENDRDIELMKEIGAYVAQGFYYAKPQPMDVFENKLSLQKTGRDA